MTDNQIEGQQIKNIKRERKVIKGRLKQERAKRVIRFFTTVGLVIFMLLFSRLHGIYMNSNAFKFVGSPSVEIINNKIVPSYKILAILQTLEPPKGCIFFAKTTEINKQLRKLKPIEKIYIRRYAFPTRLQIIVRERIPAITISPNEKTKPIAYFTMDGQLIGKEYMPLNSDIKTLLVLSYGNKGDDYRKWNIAKINELQKLAKYVETYTNEPVEYIDCRNPQDIYVKVQSINIRLGKIDNSVWERIERIPILLPQIKTVKSKIKYLDLRWEKVNYLKLE